VPRTYRHCLPRASLPEVPEERASLLASYFPEHVADAELQGNEWSVLLWRPDDPAFHVDPRLDEGLRWWSPRLTASGIAEAVLRTPRSCVSLLDSWGLVALTEWMQGRLSQDESPRAIFLHADDHGDMGSPLLAVAPSGYTDLMTGRPVALTNPVSVMKAVISGGVGIGSFLAPFLHAQPNMTFRHLRHLTPVQPGWGSRPFLGTLQPVCNEDGLLSPGAARPAVRLERGERPLGNSCGPGGEYSATADAAVWVAGLPAGLPVLLHLDLDFLNNRYDGDSDWRLSPARLDPSAERVLARVDEVFDALEGAVPAERLELVHIAFSPGFFPAELWAPTYALLRERLARLDVDLPAAPGAGAAGGGHG